MTVHVYPQGDDCICGPTAEAVFREDGSNGWVMQHHSLDGREHRELDHDRDACPLCSAAGRRG